MWPLPPIHKSSAGHGWRAGRSGTRRSGGRVLRRARRHKENKRARRSEPLVLRPRLDSGGELRRAGRCAAGAVPGRGGPRTGRPARRRAWGRGSSREQGSGHCEGVSRAVAERPRTPAGFLGCDKREPQRSAPAPGSCDLAGLRATPSTRLPISGRGAGLGPQQGAGERWPRVGGCLHAGGLRLWVLSVSLRRW